MAYSTGSQAEEFDVLILGSGEAGKYLSWTLGGDGKRVALVERRYIGGSCPNIACLPSKNIVHSAKVAWYAQRLNEFGMNLPSPGIDMTVVRDRKRAMVNGLVDVHNKRFAANHVEFICGEGVFVGPRMLSVELQAGGSRLLTAKTIIVNTGSRATVPDIPGLRAAQPMTHVEELELDTLPEHLLVIGAGYVGLEFAQAMARFGSRVTVVDRNERLLPREDEDVSATLGHLLGGEGIRFLLGSTLESVSGRSGETVEARIRSAAGEEVVKATHILAAAGRAPNTEGIGLDKAGIHLNANGHIRVDASLRTTADGVYAVGDSAGSPYFTHVAYDDYRIVYRTLKGESRVTTGRQLPYTLFTDPELAHVGLREDDAKRQGTSYRLAKLPMAAVLRTRTLGETEGFFKALIGDDDRILGFTALGASAGELLAPVQLAMSAGLPYTALRDLIVTHPTLTEGLVYLFSAVPGK
ncbi:PF00070 family, FAD-dependent NAD(P)-disulfide oxidoreductase [Acidisarcina polymorpha]|uniref:PF00070 family, FAD-dependent NAD(P)-disulfide oxidoreductase n=2 Tax=Acidisarcina polymorpha TaxID=2211140 RepID=A0A2Z5GAD3_9BACT|nr:PF00070 family, FAD-dependent NAD(P)-disulfide oxidoreductase [Acidisarcina polymorpha]